MKYLIILCCTLLLASCAEKKGAEPLEDVNKVIMDNLRDMYLNRAREYHLFKTYILLSDYLDKSDGKVICVTNLFQVVTDGDKSGDVHVFMYTNTKDTVCIDERVGYWTDDDAINDGIELSFEEAYNIVKNSGLPLPHSRHCVLQNNMNKPQYVFGNNYLNRICVDAITGKISR